MSAHRFGWILSASMLVSLAHAETIPVPGPHDARVRTARYQSDEVYRVAGFVGYQIHVEFEPGEHFVGLAAGDMDALTFTAQFQHLFLKPKAVSVATNLTVLTDRRAYQFEYSAAAHRPDPDRESVIYSLRFTYPPIVASATPASAIERRQIAELQINRALSAAPPIKNLDYAYCGRASLRPVSVFDDGIQTHLRFAARADIPAIFVRNADDSESLVNFTVEADQVIVHRVAERLILRRGRSSGCVVNRAFAGGGIRLPTGTVSSEVERRTRTGAP